MKKLFVLCLLLCATISMLGKSIEVSYVFSSKKWECTSGENLWVSVNPGYLLKADRGVQVSEKTSGAGCVTADSFGGVTKVVVTYCTNQKTGSGSISVGVGDDESQSFDVETPTADGEALKDAEFTFDSKSGKVSLVVETETNSIFIYGVTIQYEAKQQTVSVPDSKWTTVCLPFRTSLPEGVNAFYAKTDGNDVVLSKIENDIPANTGFIVNAESDEVTFEECSLSHGDVDEAVNTNELIGTTDEEGMSLLSEQDLYYVLVNGTSGMGFYKASTCLDDNNESISCCEQYKAVMKVASATESDVFLLPDLIVKQTTGVSQTLNTDLNTCNKDAYSLQGVKVNGNSRGYVIKNKRLYLNTNR